MSRSLALVFVFLVAIAFRLPGVFWGDMDRSSYIILEPDEFQHLDIALAQLKRFAPERYKDWQPPSTWNLKGYGTQLALVVLVADYLGLVEVQQNKIVLLGRCLSLFYSLLLIFLIYKSSFWYFKNFSIAILAALLLAIFDLNITYSHYALPAIAYNFWTYAAICSMVYLGRLFINGGKKIPLGLLFALSLALSAALAVKLDFIPLLFLAILMCFLWIKKYLSFLQVLTIGISIIIFTIFGFYLVHGFAISFQELKYSFDIARQLNENVVAQDQHFLHNLIVYPFGIIAGSSLPVFIAAVFGGILLWQETKLNTNSEQPRFEFFFFLLFLGLEFGVRWYLDTTFIRRANMFLPFLAILSAYCLVYVYQHKNKISPPIIIAYTLLLSLISQSNFWQDTRYLARPFIQDQIPSNSGIFYSSYAHIPGMPEASAATPEEGEWLIIHESYYGRYWKYFTTPFKIPDCCEEVYHCQDETTCRFYQEVLHGTAEYTLEKGFYTREWMPERWLFKKLLGTYETFLGDLLIYKRTPKK